MFTVYFQVAGIVYFYLICIILGIILRNNPDLELAQKTSRIVHFSFHSTLTFPTCVGFLYPKISKFDSLLSWQSLPNSLAVFILGIIIVIVGLYYIGSSIRALKIFGNGFPAFLLTKSVVHKDIYQSLRNPMSLGHYCVYIGVSLMNDSSYFLVYSVLGVIPCHIFHLMFFEEYELQTRLGKQYLEYKKKVPFLIPRFKKKNHFN